MSEQLSLLDDESQTACDASAESLVIRESRRARRLILQVVPPNGLEVVVPRGTRAKHVQAFVDENRAWIRRARDEIRRQGARDGERLPATISLKATGETYTVRYRAENAEPSMLTTQRDVLSIGCGDDGYGAAQGLLRQWLVAMGKQKLTPWLEGLAERMGEKPQRVQIRLQKTRWGSYSESGTLSLNASLLLLTPALARYLMIHELAHMRHLDHSRAFWRRVAEFEPAYRTLDRRLGRAWRELPLWVFAR